MQGPYVYALYQHYGYSTGEIGKLFIAGFGSSMIVGTVVGALADTHGRKRASLAYCAFYILSCATKHWQDFRVLLAGRLLGGVATSLLFSAFESWLVSEHNKARSQRLDASCRAQPPHRRPLARGRAVVRRSLLRVGS